MFLYAGISLSCFSAHILEFAAIMGVVYGYVYWGSSVGKAGTIGHLFHRITSLNSRANALAISSAADSSVNAIQKLCCGPAAQSVIELTGSVD